MTWCWSPRAALVKSRYKARIPGRRRERQADRDRPARDRTGSGQQPGDGYSGPLRAARAGSRRAGCRCCHRRRSRLSQSLPIVGARPGAGCSPIYNRSKTSQTRGHTLNFTDCRLTAAGTVLYLFENLKEIASSYLPPEQVEKLRQAYVVARDAHQGQMRSSGEPYITHPVAVARILGDMRLDHETLMAAVLHDVIEDTLSPRTTWPSSLATPSPSWSPVSPSSTSSNSAIARKRRSRTSAR